MKRIYRLFSFVLVLVLVFALAVGLTGCGTKTQEAKPKEGAAEEKPSEGAGEASKEPFKVALLTPGSISDAGWNASAYEGLKAIEQELGATISNLETKAPAEFEEGLRSYASQGFDLIFARGFEYQDAAKKIADQFPDTVFVITSGTDPYGKNVSPLIFLEEEGYYIMGLAAAKLTKSNKIGLMEAWKYRL